MTSQGVCKRCGQRVLWATTDAHGRRMPLEWAEHPDGTIAVRRERWALACRVCYPREDLHPGETRHRPHAEVCTGASVIPIQRARK